MNTIPTDPEMPQTEEEDVKVQAGDGGDEIKPTDIVFDCPHCGHNLAIDYRGAGLQINCVECNHPVLVPIPEGMKIDDLDLSPGELLTQLFQTRRMMLKAEQRISELEEALSSIKSRRTELEKSRITTLHRCAELVSMCQSITRFQNDVTTTVNRMLALIAEEQQR
jgi:DNA-directed RNA polymerase subunit RPC12/RpoP